LDIEEKEIIPFVENNLGTQTGGFIEMIVDLDNFLITFTRRVFTRFNLEEKVTIAEIPKSFAGKKLYVYARMRSPKDAIDIVED